MDGGSLVSFDLSQRGSLSLKVIRMLSHTPSGQAASARFGPEPRLGGLNVSLSSEGLSEMAAAEVGFGVKGGGAGTWCRSWPIHYGSEVHGCGSKIGTQNGTLVSGNMDQNLWSAGGLILTHTHMVGWGNQ